MKRWISMFLIGALAIGSFAGCKSDQPKTNETTPSSAAASTDANAGENNTTGTTGEITVLTNRTDLVDTTFKKYAEEFESKHPGSKVKFESMADYQGEVTTRMSTVDYGDVLLVPSPIPKNQYPDFFLPLGTEAEISAKYNYSSDYVVDGQAYGISTGNNASGIAYNEKVLEEAGVTKLPETPQEFMDMLKQIKEKTSAIPLYTNYAAGWTLTPYVTDTGVAYYGVPQWKAELLKQKTPFSPNGQFYDMLNILYTAVKDGYVEEDPITSDWETSKKLMAENKIGVLFLGSWVVGQLKDISPNPEAIKFMPMPIRHDGKAMMQIGHDYGIAVNKNTKYPDLAKEFVTFFVEKYPSDSNMISSIKGAELPDFLKDLQNVEFVEEIPVSLEDQGKLDEIQKEALLNIYDATWIKPIIEIGLGSKSGTYDEYMNSLNAEWSKAYDNVIK